MASDEFIKQAKETELRRAVCLGTLGVAAVQWAREKDDAGGEMLKWLTECARKYADADHDHDRSLYDLGREQLKAAQP